MNHKAFTRLLTLILLAFVISPSSLLGQDKSFTWPDGKKIAISFSWDDGRESQVKVGTPILDKYGVKATFYIVPSLTLGAKDGWQKAADNGHELANHTLMHPCSGNFLWARGNALEGYDLKKMEAELLEANKEIEKLYGVKTNDFAYPCGQTFVNRGTETRSYVPVVAKNFVSGRTWLDEVPNDPAFCDLAQLTGVEMDNKSMEDIMALIEMTRKDGLWLVLAGHDIGENGVIQTTHAEMLEKLLPYLLENSNEIWVAPVGEIADYVKQQRGF
ncbi:Polysaccharide deacetylase [Spirosomataceae bacterium TFI 002]|nr:Polysaccharide deacetylase [Spirosomataceae bacterium TFI 002]